MAARHKKLGRKTVVPIYVQVSPCFNGYCPRVKPQLGIVRNIEDLVHEGGYLLIECARSVEYRGITCDNGGHSKKIMAYTWYNI